MLMKRADYKAVKHMDNEQLTAYLKSTKTGQLTLF